MPLQKEQLSRMTIHGFKSIKSCDISFGKINVLIGSNGAGKSTAIRMLCGLSLPTSGSGTVVGYDILTQSELLKRNIGYMSQRFSLYNDLTVNENIRLFAGIYGMRRPEIAEKSKVLLTSLGIETKANTLVGALPLGEKQNWRFPSRRSTTRSSSFSMSRPVASTRQREEGFGK